MLEDYPYDDMEGDIGYVDGFCVSSQWSLEAFTQQECNCHV